MKSFSANKSVLVKRISLIGSFVFLFTIYHLLISVSPVHAADFCQPVPPDQNTAETVFNQTNLCAAQADSYDSTMFNFGQMSATIDSGFTLLLGTSFLHPATNVVTADSGAVRMANNMVAGLYTRPPISGTYYIAEKLRQINPVQPAYAQSYPGGIGYSILQPVNRIWSAFRNAAYVGFVIIFVIIGFMIMFRRKISSQAVATIQDSLPRIVIALILVTFSYAIVGLIIDGMFVLLNVIAALLVSAGLTQDGANKIFSDNIFSIVFGSMKDIFAAITVAIKNLLDGLLDAGYLGGIIGSVGGGIVGIIAAIAVLMVSLRIFLMLLMAYVSLILLTIFAPFILLFEALPGNNSFKEWFKQIIANLSVFPTVAVMIMLAGLISGVGALGGVGDGLIGQRDIGNFPLLSGVFGAGDIGKLIGLGLLLMTPSAAKIVKERLGVKEGQMGAGGAAALAGLGAGAALGRKAGPEIAGQIPGVRNIGEQIAAHRALPGERRAAAIEELSRAKAGRISGFYKKKGAEQPPGTS